MGAEVDYRKQPAEDFARATVRYVDETGQPLIVEATTSWSFVGAGLRLSMELLGPEYSMSVNTLDSGAKRLLQPPRAGHGGRGPGREAERRAGPDAAAWATSRPSTATRPRTATSCARFLDGVQPEENWHAGLEVIELLMTAYMSAEQETSLDWKPEGLERFVPAVARGDWKP